jgi:hypothetical protein
MNSLTRGLGAIRTVRSGSSGAGAARAQATGRGRRQGRARRRYSGERQCEGETALGCTIGRGNSTRTTRAHARRQRRTLAAAVRHPGRRTARGRLGAALATSTRRCGARERKQTTHVSSLPCGGTAERLPGDGKAATARFNTAAQHGSAAATRVWWRREVLGFGDSWGGVVEAAHLNRWAGVMLARGPGGAGVRRPDSGSTPSRNRVRAAGGRC